MNFPSTRKRRSAVIPTGSMQTVNVLLVVAGALCVLAGVAGTLAR